MDKLEVIRKKHVPFVRQGVPKVRPIESDEFYEEDRDWLISVIERLRKILKETSITLNHARIFIDSRQRMHKDGIVLYDECLKQSLQELKEE